MTPSFIPRPLPPKGFVVPVDDIRTTFLLFNFLSFGGSRNSINPRLVLHDTKLEVKVIKTDCYEYSAISKADYKPKGFLSSACVVLELPTHSLDFILYVSTAVAERALLQFLHSQGVALSAAAQKVAAG